MVPISVYFLIYYFDRVNIFRISAESLPILLSISRLFLVPIARVIGADPFIFIRFGWPGAVLILDPISDTTVCAYEKNYDRSASGTAKLIYIDSWEKQGDCIFLIPLKLSWISQITAYNISCRPCAGAWSRTHRECSRLAYAHSSCFTDV